MSKRLCPNCERPVSRSDLRCAACGVGLPEDDTVPSAFDATPRWTAEQRQLEFLELTLRPVEGEDLPPIDDIVSPVDVFIETDSPTVPATGTSLALSPADQAGRLRKTAKRAAVRRARLERAVPAECTDVLVFDRDETARRPLCELLAGFGFEVHLAADLKDAAEITRSRHLAAAFVDVALDDDADGSAVDLCRAIKAARRSAGGATAALLLYSAKVTPVGWIRAQMAGCDAFIDKPARRGSVARALETCAVPLPADARRS